MWVMREYGVAESWTPLVGIFLGGGRLGKTLYTKGSNVLMVTDFGELVLFTRCGWDTCAIQGSKDSLHVEEYVESLVLLNHRGGTSMGNDDINDAASHVRGEAEVKQNP
ncbi:F-box domain-containing protein [Forsythia ovata]|uniref:F-box domain-containing protein n=1 Tax=Forsythia ovata TaxID=205694 RepID=A0ABD1SJY6_9LAMI